VLTFSACNLANIKTQLWLFLLFRFFLISFADVEKLTSYIFTSAPAFSQVYVHRVQLTFSPIKLASQRSISALSATDFFTAYCSQKKKITPNSVDAGRCSMNSDNALNFDIR